MIIRNTNQKELEQALKMLNQMFSNNIRFNYFRSINKKQTAFGFTLRANNSKETGARKSANGRRLTACCWHVHGFFFDLLFNLNKNIKIYSQGNLITNDNNWEFDKNIGNIFNPVYLSETCSCDIDKLNKKYFEIIQK